MLMCMTSALLIVCLFETALIFNASKNTNQPQFESNTTTTTNVYTATLSTSTSASASTTITQTTSTSTSTSTLLPMTFSACKLINKKNNYCLFNAMAKFIGVIECRAVPAWLIRFEKHNKTQKESFLIKERFLLQTNYLSEITICIFPLTYNDLDDRQRWYVIRYQNPSNSGNNTSLIWFMIQNAANSLLLRTKNCTYPHLITVDDSPSSLDSIDFFLWRLECAKN